MTSRARNFAILGVVLLLLVLSLLVIVPGIAALEGHEAGARLEGGIELVYQGRPTPQVPEVTQQALDDATETIRKRTDALGVSEPEIQRSGKDQISIGLPDVQNAQRAIEQVGTTAQLQFYDWDPNVLGDRGPDNPFAGTKALYDAVEFASTQKPRPSRPTCRRTPTHAGAGRQAEQHHGRPVLHVRPRPAASAPTRSRFEWPTTSPRRTARSCSPTTTRLPGRAPGVRQGHRVPAPAGGPGRRGGPPAGSKIYKVPEGVLVVEGEPAENQPPQIKRFFVIEDDSSLSGKDIKDPKQDFDQNQQPWCPSSSPTTAASASPT